MHKQAISMQTFGLKYLNGKHLYTALISPMMLSLTYTQRYYMFGVKMITVSSDFSLGASPTGSVVSAWSIGTEYAVGASRYKVKFDNSLNAHMVYDEEVQAGTKFTFCADLNHSKKDYKFGVGISMGV